MILPEGKIFSGDTAPTFTAAEDKDLSGETLVRGGYFGTGNTGKWALIDNVLNITGTLGSFKPQSPRLILPTP